MGYEFGDEHVAHIFRVRDSAEIKQCARPAWMYYLLSWQPRPCARVVHRCGKFAGDIGRWNTSSVTVLSSAFRNCMTFNQSLSAWDTSSVQKFDATFADCISFSGAGIGRWDTSSATTMRAMFLGCAAFNADIGGWVRCGNNTLDARRGRT